MVTRLDRQRNAFAVVVNFKDNVIDLEIITKLEAYLLNKSTEYHFILHDKDFENGVKKTNHIHCFFKTEGIIRLRTILFELTNYLFGDSKYTNLISIDSWSDYELMIQYLIHKNDKDKYQYNISDIHSSLTLSNIEAIMNIDSKSSKVDIKFIKSVCEECSSLVEVYDKLGIFYTYRYHSIIKDIFANVKHFN